MKVDLIFSMVRNGENQNYLAIRQSALACVDKKLVNIPTYGGGGW